LENTLLKHFCGCFLKGIAMSNFGFVSWKRWAMRLMSGGGFAVKFQGLQILRYGALGQIARSSKVKESGKMI
jgi:hypothetical protein